MVTLGNWPRRVCVAAAGVHLMEGKEDGGVRAGALGKNWMLILGRMRPRRACVALVTGANLLVLGRRGRPRLQQRRRRRAMVRQPARGSTRKSRPKPWLRALSRCWVPTAAWTRAPSCSARSRSGWRRRRWCIAYVVRCIVHLTSGVNWLVLPNFGRRHRCECLTESPFRNSDASAMYRLG